MDKKYRNPDSPWNPRHPVEITPTQFEQQVEDWFNEVAERENLTCTVTRLEMVEGGGGTYQIDVLVKLCVLEGAEIKILAECKHQRRAVERGEILALEAKLRDVRAHKGMMFSTSGFQSGAIKYAEAYGIATVTVIAGEWLFETKAREPTPTPPPWMEFDRFAGIRVTPTDSGISSHTIGKGRPDALLEWLNLPQAEPQEGV